MGHYIANSDNKLRIPIGPQWVLGPVHLPRSLDDLEIMQVMPNDSGKKQELVDTYFENIRMSKATIQSTKTDIQSQAGECARRAGCSPRHSP